MLSIDAMSFKSRSVSGLTGTSTKAIKLSGKNITQLSKLKRYLKTLSVVHFGEITSFLPNLCVPRFIRFRHKFSVSIDPPSVIWMMSHIVTNWKKAQI